MLKAFALRGHLSFMYNKMPVSYILLVRIRLQVFCLSANQLTGYGKFISG